MKNKYTLHKIGKQHQDINIKFILLSLIVLKGAFTRVRSNASDSIESLFYIPSGDCYNAGTEFIENVITILLRSSTNPDSELDRVFYQKCQAAESLDEEEQTTSQDNKVSLSKHEGLPSSSNSTISSSPTDIEINTGPVLTTTSGNNDQRKNSTIDILNINRVTKVFSSTILTTTPSTESSG